MSLSTTHLLVGTQAGEIHIHSLPSHQHLRTMTSHSSPITHLSTALRPPDLIGSRVKLETWPIMDVKPFERMRNGRSAQEVQEISIVIRPSKPATKLEQLRIPRNTALSSSGERSGTDSGARIAILEEENKRLRANLDRAVKINEKMWSGVVDLKLAEPITNGNAR